MSIVEEIFQQFNNRRKHFVVINVRRPNRIKFAHSRTKAYNFNYRVKTEKVWTSIETKLIINN